MTLPLPLGPDAFARVLRQTLISLRLAKKLSIKDAAVRAGLSRGGLEKIEAGANLPSIDSLRQLCSVYDTSASTVLGQVEQQLGIAQALRTSHDTASMTAQEQIELYREWARRVGREEELALCDHLARVKESQPDLHRALVATISAAAGAKTPKTQGLTQLD